MQRIALGVAYPVHAQVHVPRQFLLQTHHHVALPSVVARVERRAFHVHIGDAAVEHEAWGGGERVVGVEVQSQLMAFHHVAVGGVEQVVFVVEAVLLDRVVAEAVAQRGVHHEFL